MRATSERPAPPQVAWESTSHASDCSSFGIAINRKHAFKWLFITGVPGDGSWSLGWKKKPPFTTLKSLRVF